jgi:hypothetical protein
MPIKDLLRYIDRVKAQYIKSFLMDRHEEANRLNICLLLLRQSLEETLKDYEDLIREVS